METKIKEVQNYFINKLVDADFEILKGDKYSINVLVEKQYRFQLWIASGIDNLRANGGSGDSFIQLPDFTKKQKEQLYSKIEATILEYTGTGFKRKTIQAQIEKLQYELENLAEL